MTRQWTAEQIAAVAVHIAPEYPMRSVELATKLLDACADESERRAKVAEEEPCIECGGVGGHKGTCMSAGRR